MNGQINKKIIKLNWPELLRFPLIQMINIGSFIEPLSNTLRCGQVLVGKV